MLWSKYLKTAFVSCLILYSIGIKAQDIKTGVIGTPNGALLFFNDAQPHTLELNGKVDLEHYPMIRLNEEGFQFLSNNNDNPTLDTKSTLLAYMDWEVAFLNDTYGKKMEVLNTFITSGDEILNFWYFTNPILENAPKDVTPFKMTFLLDWKHGSQLYKLVLPSYNTNIDEAKSFLLNLQQHVRYYSKPIDTEKLRMQIEKGVYFYSE